MFHTLRVGHCVYRIQKYWKFTGRPLIVFILKKNFDKLRYDIEEKYIFVYVYNLYITEKVLTLVVCLVLIMK